MGGEVLVHQGAEPNAWKQAIIGSAPESTRAAVASTGPPDTRPAAGTAMTCRTADAALAHNTRNATDSPKTAPTA